MIMIMKKIFFGIMVLGIGYFIYNTPLSMNNKIVDNHDGTITVTEYSLSGDSTTNKYKSDEITKGVVIESNQHLSKNLVRIKCGDKIYDDRVYDDECNGKRPKVGDTVNIVNTHYPVETTKIDYIH